MDKMFTVGIEDLPEGIKLDGVFYSDGIEGMERAYVALRLRYHSTTHQLIGATVQRVTLINPEEFDAERWACAEMKCPGGGCFGGSGQGGWKCPLWLGNARSAPDGSMELIPVEEIEKNGQRISELFVCAHAPEAAIQAVGATTNTPRP
jgi:hypothetical protein